MFYRYYQILSFSLPASSAYDMEKKLFSLGCLGMEKAPLQEGRFAVRAYFEDDNLVQLLTEKLVRNFSGIKDIKPTMIGLPELREGSPSLAPFPLLPDLWVVPPYQADPELRHHHDKILIYPGLAFGSGRHETTRLMARLMGQINFIPRSLLDVGTGSGILALLARKRNIPKVDAVEILEEAQQNALRNFHINHCEDINLFHHLDQIRDTYEVILANLLTPTLIHIKDKLLERLTPGGNIILSGITKEEVPLIRESFSSLTMLQKLGDGDWVGMILASNSGK